MRPVVEVVKEEHNFQKCITESNNNYDKVKVTESLGRSSYEFRMKFRPGQFLFTVRKTGSNEGISTKIPVVVLKFIRWTRAFSHVACSEKKGEN